MNWWMNQYFCMYEWTLHGWMDEWINILFKYERLLNDEWMNESIFLNVWVDTAWMNEWLNPYFFKYEWILHGCMDEWINIFTCMSGHCMDEWMNEWGWEGHKDWLSCSILYGHMTLSKVWIIWLYYQLTSHKQRHSEPVWSPL